MGRPVDLDETVLDEGRQRWFSPREYARLAETLLDPGRRRPDGSGPQEWPEQGLPDLLAARYELIRRLDTVASQGELYLVRVRADGTEAVLKRRHTARALDPGLVAYLQAPDEHIVRHLEAGPGYEVMAYLPGHTLRQQLETDRRGFGFAELHVLVDQISAALIHLHRAGFLHRDVKPANLMARPSGPPHVTLIDFGIAGPQGATQWPDEPSVAYQPPEWSNVDRVGKETDWWGLGMTVLELASGEHPFEDLTEEDIRGHFGASRAIDVSGVPDDPPAGDDVRPDRLRNLCQGLLAPDPAARWGEEQVGQWLVGADPDLPHVQTSRTAPTESTAVAAEQPYEFAGRAYHVRAELAVGMTTAWHHAVHVLFERGGISGLREWLDQFPDDEGAEARGVVEAAAADPRQPGDVRLLRVVRALDPTRPPVYRNHVISRRHLMRIAIRALENDSDNASVLADLWNHDLLPGFDSAASAEPEVGGEDLTGIDRQWRHVHGDWPALLDRVAEPAARDHLRNAVDDRDVLAVCLLMALDQPDELAKVQREFRQKAAALPVRMPWFDQVVRDPATVWLAPLLYPQVLGRATVEADQQAAAVRAQDTAHAQAAFREWSRRQNRPAALGWAVAGICLMAALWFLLITVSDLAERAGDAGIERAWVVAAVCLVVSSIAECLLAAEIGGRFHRRYSIPGAGLIALRPVGRWMRRSRLTATAVILATAAGVGLVTLEHPLLLVAATTIGHLGWVPHRLRAWQAYQRAEDAQITAAELRRPSDTEAIPIGAVGGVSS